jgi:hypothetical protein
MIPQSSELSYGLALTNEIVAWAPLTIAPTFPSLIEEGKKGGRGAKRFCQFRLSQSVPPNQ